MKKKMTYRFFVYDKEGNPVNIDTLSPEKREEIGVELYQRLVRGLGYVPVDEAKAKST